ncbi:MAG: condensation domain-containing protein, partial [Candidatus Latescibacterota bacterium]
SVLLERVRATVTDSFAHQYYPFDRMVEDRGITRDPARNPLFDVLFVLQNIGDTDLALGDLRVEPLREDVLMSKFDLMFDFQDLPELSGNIEFCTDLFTSESVAALGRDLTKILAAVTEDCHLKVKELCRLLVSEHEERAREELLKASMAVDEDF